MIEANCHDNIKEFLGQEIQHPEIINNVLQLIHLIKKQSNQSFPTLSQLSNIDFLEEFLTKEQLQEYKPLLEHIGASQNCAGRRLIDRTIAVIQDEVE